MMDDGDVGFAGMNLRLPPWQLKAGELAMSSNGRIDGHWVPRRGVDVVTAESLAEGSPLRLPFWLVDANAGGAEGAQGLVVSAASRVDDVVTLTVTGHGFAPNASAVQATLDPSGANNGILVAAAVGIESGVVSVEVLVPVEGVAAPAVVLVVNKVTVTPVTKAKMVISGGALDLDGAAMDGRLTYAGTYNDFPSWTSDGAPYSNLGTQTSITREGGTFIVRRFVAGFEKYFSDESYGLTWPDDVGAYYNNPSTGTGRPTVTAGASTAADVITAMNAEGSVASLMTASNAVGSAGTGDMAAVAETFLFGNAGDPAYLKLEGITAPTADPNAVWLMTPTNANTLTFEIPGAVGNETYTITSARVLAEIDDFATGDVLAACIFSDPGSSNDESVFLAYGAQVKRVVLGSGAVTDIGLPSGETLDGEVNMVQAMDKVLILRAGKVALEWQSGDTDFALVANGVYAQPQILSSNGSAISIVDGLVEFTVTGNTTIAVGDYITVYSATDTRFTGVVGERYFVVSIGGSTLVRCYIPLADSASGSNTVQIGKRVTIGGGFIHQPGFPWAIYFQRRLWGPYQYDWDVSLTPDAFSDREVRDELIASDILDSDTYDAIASQFRITGGAADHIVALHPFFDDTLLVFNRNSIHSVSGTVGSLADCSVRELTREIGCIARRSVVSQGNSVFFLSDNGIYGLAFADQYNLRGVERPLSENIQPYIDRISHELAGAAVGAYFNNRYWLAVPLDSAPRQGDAIGNNAVLVYNLLNREWESIDTYGDPNFLITDLLIGSAGARNDIYAVTTLGGIHVLDKADEDYDNIATNSATGGVQFAIDASLTTRGFMCGTMDRKRFSEMGAQVMGGSSQCDMSLTFSTDDPDATGSTVLASDTLGGNLAAADSADLRARVGGLRGYHGQITIARRIGRPQIRSVRVTGSSTNRATISQK